VFFSIHEMAVLFELQAVFAVIRHLIVTSNGVE